LHTVSKCIQQRRCSTFSLCEHFRRANEFEVKKHQEHFNITTTIQYNTTQHIIVELLFTKYFNVNHQWKIACSVWQICWLSFVTTLLIWSVTQTVTDHCKYFNKSFFANTQTISCNILPTSIFCTEFHSPLSIQMYKDFRHFYHVNFLVRNNCVRSNFSSSKSHIVNR